MVAVAADPPTRLARTHPAATATPTCLSHDRVNISVLPLTPGHSTGWVLHCVLASTTNSTPQLSRAKDLHPEERRRASYQDHPRDGGRRHNGDEFVPPCAARYER